MKQPSKFAVFDIDGTLIRWQLYHAIADNLVRLGFIAPVKFQAIKEARMVWKRRESRESFKNYELELVKLYSNILAEITPHQFSQTAEAVFEEYKDQVYTYTRDLISRLKADGYKLFAISGSQEGIIRKLANYYGFDDFAARVDEQLNGRFTGKSTTPIFNKDAALSQMVQKQRSTYRGSIGVGDSATDIKMLKLVEKPIAFNPEQALYKYAKKRGWKMVIERKNVIYELNQVDGKYQLA